MAADGAVTVLKSFGAGLLDAQAQHLAQVPPWDHHSRRKCPEYGAPDVDTLPR